MKVYQCTKCNSKHIYVDEIGGQVGLYCNDCGRWIKWLSKNEAKYARRQEEASKKGECDNEDA